MNLLLCFPFLFLARQAIPDGIDPIQQVTGSERRILYATYLDGIQEIFSMNPDGSRPRQLTQTPADDYRRGIYRGSGEPAWFPDWRSGPSYLQPDGTSPSFTPSGRCRP